MARDLPKQESEEWIAVDVSVCHKVFTQRALKDSFVRVPSTYHCLPDFRPASERATFEALEGWPPQSAQLPRFDPLLGPFSLEKAAFSPWAQSLDFMRDIKSASIGPTKLAQAWIETWIKGQSRNDEVSAPWFSTKYRATTKTDRLIWRSLRILNCLSHVLPLLPSFDPDVRSAFWNQLFEDIGKIGAPSQTLWESLKDGFHPLSARAKWLRAIAILGVEAACPGYVQPYLIGKSNQEIGACIQNDGLVVGGSIVSTLTAGADLCMLARSIDTDHVLEKIRGALAFLRHSDGTLITFGSGSGDHTRLLAAVLGPGDWKTPNLLLGSGIGRMSAQKTTIWLRAHQPDRHYGSACEIEFGGGTLITSSSDYASSIVFEAPALVTQARCKRRDEPDWIVLEASAALTISGKSYTSVRQIRMNQKGTKIIGEDLVRADANTRTPIVKEICFGISSTSKCYLSKDKLSVLIVTSQQQAWRFRPVGLDIGIEMRFDDDCSKNSMAGHYIIVCRCLEAHEKSDFKASWQISVEEIE